MRTCSVLAIATLTALVTACGTFAPCGRTSVIDTQGVFSLTTATGFPATPDSTPPPQLELGTGPLYDSNLRQRPGVFADLWATLTEGAVLPTGQGVAITLEGRNPADLASIARLVVILPTPLRTGRSWPFGRVFPAPAGLENPDVFGTRYLGREPLATAATAEIAMFYGRRVFENGAPLATEVVAFMATTADGTVTVLSDTGRELRLRFDVVLGDAAGRMFRITGTATTTGSTSTNSCTS